MFICLPFFYAAFCSYIKQYNHLLVGVGRLIKIDSKITGGHYVNILEENLYSSTEEMGLREFIFYKGNGPKHTNKVAKKYFEENNVENLELPAQNPDLNPMKHLWAILDDKIPMECRTNFQTFWEKMEGNSYKYFEEPCAKYAE